MAHQSCPPIDSLEAFLLGKSRGSKLLELADHLLICPRCARIIETMSANDELTSALGNQNPPDGTDATVPQLSEAIEIALELKSKTSTKHL